MTNRTTNRNPSELLCDSVRSLKPCPNGCNISRKHIATLLSCVVRCCKGAGQTHATLQRNISQPCWAQHVAYVCPPCCNMLEGLLREKFDQVQTWVNSMQHVAACCNMHGGQTCATCCAHQCCDLLCWKCCESLAWALKSTRITDNNVNKRNSLKYSSIFLNEPVLALL